MSTRANLVDTFETQRTLIHRFADGLTQGDSLAVPHFRTNNFNWVLGHILVSRNRVLALLGQSEALTAVEAARYETGARLVDSDTAVELTRLLAALDDSQAAISAGMQAATEADLAAPYSAGSNQNVLQRIEGLLWHETYHLGQLEILRQVSAERSPFP